MPGKIKALWSLCMVVIVAGFLVLAFQGEMDKASEQVDAAYQLAAEEQKKIAEKTIQIPHDYVFSRRLFCLRLHRKQHPPHMGFG